MMILLRCKKFASTTLPFLLPSLTSEPDQNQPVGGERVVNSIYKKMMIMLLMLMLMWVREKVLSSGNVDYIYDDDSDDDDVHDDIYYDDNDDYNDDHDDDDDHR